jgi:hypothetical protein
MRITFSDGHPAFLMSMGAPEIGCIDSAEVLLHRMAQDPLVEKNGRLGLVDPTSKGFHLRWLVLCPKLEAEAVP